MRSAQEVEHGFFVHHLMFFCLWLLPLLFCLGALVLFGVVIAVELGMVFRSIARRATITGVPGGSAEGAGEGRRPEEPAGVAKRTPRGGAVKTVKKKTC